jgi:hypothetical protein
MKPGPLCRLGALLLMSSCTLSQLTPQAKFQDAAYTLNDAARWNNVDVSIRYVAPAYAERFTSRRRQWGGGLSIGEYELLRLTMAEDKRTAVSEVQLTWFDQGGVRVHSSTISQRWEKTQQGYFLADETVRSGDPNVFAAPEEETAAP